MQRATAQPESDFRRNNATVHRTAPTAAVKPDPAYVCQGFKWNQYSKPPFPSMFKMVYEDLIKSCRVEWCAAHLFDCWIPDPTRRQGLERLPSGYLRLNFSGRDVQAHVFTFLYWKPLYRVDGDISHLCGNPSCCNPDHLFEEDRNSNINRRFCPGILVDSATDYKYRLCKHQPRCCTSTFFNSVTDFYDNKEDAADA